MIVLHYGGLGAGKSAYCTYEVWKALLKGFNVYVNWPIDFSKFWLKKKRNLWWRMNNPGADKKFGKLYIFRSLDEIYGIKNGIIFYDEASLDLDARSWSTTPKEFRRKLVVSRKQRLDLHFIVQYPDQIDNTIRNLANIVRVYNHAFRFYYYTEYDGNKLQALNNPQYAEKIKRNNFPLFSTRWLSKTFLNSYDSWLEFGEEPPPFTGEPYWTVEKAKIDYQLKQLARKVKNAK